MQCKTIILSINYYCVCPVLFRIPMFLIICGFRQIQYPLENVEFETEGPKTSTCGAQTRQCNQCESYKDTETPWDWCLTRTITMRAATRLHRLATLVKEETNPGLEIRILVK